MNIRKQLERNRSVLMAGAGLGAALAAAALIRRIREADLTGKVVLITGSSRGLGFLLAREFLREGCRVAICARDEAELDRARRALDAQGKQVLSVRCDITREDDVRQMVQQVRQHYGGIDILVNNAGTIQVGPFQAMTVQDFEEALQVMFWGVLYPTLTVLPEMIARQEGRIVNVTSIGGKVGVPHLLPYTCAKFAAVGFSEGLRVEVGRHGIRVTTIVPGLMRTGSFLNAFFKGQQEREYAWFSLGAALPGISMDAERAARQIVRATRRGEAERILSMPATLLARVHGLFPGLTAGVMSVVNRVVLPGPEGGVRENARGMDVNQRAHSAVRGALMGMGLSAAQRCHQYAA